mmetsp:Transcript_20105/g.48624  ORF Transcript_20105/g.48624 Transcript_20105/m.48624 type:complete len:350 (+) Transcript_20105:218-1267(+)
MMRRRSGTSSGSTQLPTSGCPRRRLELLRPGWTRRCGRASGRRSRSGATCSACPVGFFKDVVGDAACRPCLSGQTASPGAISESECGIVCAPGSHLDATSSFCVACPEGRTSSAGAVSAAECGCVAQGVFTNCALNAVLVEHAPHSVYVAEAWNGSALVDLSGNGRHAVLMAGTVASAAASGDGAANAVTFISGTPSTQLLWPEWSIPPTFTICSVTRYTGGVRQRILDCDGGPSPSQSINWLHGHAGARGVAYYLNGYKTSDTNRGVLDDWLVMCGTNGAGQGSSGNIIHDQSEIGVLSGGTGNCQLNINNNGEKSHWVLHSVLIWDTSLSTTTMKTVTAALSEMIGQ